ncbi:polynucleotide adenylyltransferase PcnB [Colwellia sp. 6M3]|jgi:poly(A) polymerase|uniref:polynucleotide adenylyltransferase PcnB n=1 Tax=Colwellia sp. 6M3 TaxID=2759849 RepID=UPI0015F50677|nr:polynucleotide adenylyltransferase PcnB [Colwellia sp. 6M3]|tara:strand:- start:2591 stop:4045 length:1455 start_codon:yes stop_codon:yes gene_type:complete
MIKLGSTIIKSVINLCKKVLGKTRKNNSTLPSFEQPIILSRDQHPVSRKHMSHNALKVLYRLNKGGYDAYLVGGGVRDIILGLTPKDFDIATNATPEQIKALFRNCRLIGRRFRLAHIVFGREIIEVATFRGHHDSDEDKNCQKTSKQSEDGMLLRDNIYGSIEEDAERRDFTINALYYSAKDFKVYDFANGVADVYAKQIRLIGDPETRYREDPVRMLRAIRFSTKLGMEIHADTKAPIKSLAPLMANIPPARLFEEFLKLFMSGKAVENFQLLREYSLFQYFFPAVDQQLNQQSQVYLADFIALAMKNTDYRVNNDQRVTPAFLFAAMLWYPMQEHIERLNSETQLTPQDAFFGALSEIMSEQQRSIAIPKRFQAVMKDIWILQEKLARRDGKRAYKALEHPKFRAGYDFLLLRAEIEGDINKNVEEVAALQELAKWWGDFQACNIETQQVMVKSVVANKSGPRRAIRKRRKPRVQNSSNEA